MKINSKEEKQIIEKIKDGKVFDIISFLKEFELGSIKKYDKEVIEEKFNESEQGKEHKVLREDYDTSIGSNYMNSEGRLEFIYNYNVPKEKDYIRKKAILSFENTSSSIKYGNQNYYFNYLDGIFIPNSFENIKKFLVIWSYLKSEGLILEVDKLITKEELGIFFEQKSKSNDKNQVNLEGLSNIIEEIEKSQASLNLQNMPFMYNKNKEVVRNANEFVDFNFQYIKEYELICSKFIGKKILPTTKLELFIKHNYMTKEDRNQLYAHVASYTSLFVAFLSLVLAIGSFAKKDDTTEIINVQDRLKVIEDKMDGINSSLIEITNEKYKISDVDNIIKEINEILRNIDSKLIIEGQ